MAEPTGATGTHPNNNSSDNPHHLDTNIESGTFDEKSKHHDDAAPPAKKPEEEEEDEDMDALIDELESQDGHAEEDEAEEEATPGGGRVVPEGELQTDTRIGLTEAEVHARRKKYGMNQMKEEKENLILKFLGYFIGPIQFVMEVCYRNSFAPSPLTCFLKLRPHCLFFPPPSGPLQLLNCEAPRRQDAKNSSQFSVLITLFVIGCRRSRCRSGGLGRFWGDLRVAFAQRLGRVHPRIPGWLHCRRIEENPRPEGGCSP
jgi:magnesium-transporting ATPase (P-type)